MTESRRAGSFVEQVGFLFAAEGGEGRLVAGVDGGSILTAATSTAEVGSLSTTLAAAVTAATAAATTGTAASTAGALGLDEAGVKVNGLLDLLLTLTLLLATGGREVVDLLLLEGLGGLPLLVELATLVGRAELNAVLKGKLLLGLLDEVVGVRDALVLGLSGFPGGSILSNGLLLLGLSDGLAGLLVLQLGLALGGAPRGSSLLLGTAGNSC